MVLSIEDHGRGEVVVLFHGVPTNPIHLRPLARRLNDGGFRTLLVHSPGYLESTALPAPYDLARSHEIVEDALLSRGVTEAHFFGYSGGSRRAFDISARGHVRSKSVAGLGPIVAFMEEKKQGLSDFAAALRAGIDLRDSLVEMALTSRGKQNPRWVAEVRASLDAIAPETLADELDGFLRAPSGLPAIETIAVPIYLRVGTIDAMTPPENARAILSVAKHATLDEVPEMGHAILWEDLDATSDAILRHLHAAR